jgi:hypothetical protein
MPSSAFGTGVVFLTALLLRRSGSLLALEPRLFLFLSPLLVSGGGELPLWNGLSYVNADSLLDTPAPSSTAPNFIRGGGAYATGVGASLLRDFRPDFFMPSTSVPDSVSEALACLLLALGVLFVGLFIVATLSDSLSSALTLPDGFLPDLARGVGGGGISSSSAPIVLS